MHVGLQRLVAEVHLHGGVHVQLLAGREIFEQQQRVDAALEVCPVDQYAGRQRGGEHQQHDQPDAAPAFPLLCLFGRERRRLRVGVGYADGGVIRVLLVLHGFAQGLHLAAAGLAELMDQVDDEQHQQRREPGQHDPHPPDGEGGKRRHLHGLAGGLEAQIAADLGRFRLLPDAVGVHEVDIRCALLPVGDAEADGVRVAPILRQPQLPLLDDGLRHMRRGRVAVRDVLEILPDGLRDAGGDLTEGGGGDGLRLRLQPVGIGEGALGQEDRAAVVPLRVARQGVDAGMVFRRDGGVKGDGVERGVVPHAVLAVHGRDVGVRALVQRLAVVHFHRLEDISVRDELHGERPEGVGEGLVFHERPVGHGLCRTGDAPAVQARERVGDEAVLRERARVAARDRTGVLLIRADADERGAARDGAAAARDAVRHAAADNAAEVSPARKLAFCVAILNGCAADARHAADIVAALALHAAVGLAALCKAEVHPAADGGRAVLLGRDGTGRDAALQQRAQLVLLALRRGQALAHVAFRVDAVFQAHRARDAADVAVGLHRAGILARAHRTEGDAVRVGLRAVGDEVAVFQLVHGGKDGVVDLTELIADGLHVVLQCRGEIRRLRADGAHLRAHTAQGGGQLRHGGVGVHLQRGAERAAAVRAAGERKIRRVDKAARADPGGRAAADLQRVCVDGEVRVLPGADGGPDTSGGVAYGEVCPAGHAAVCQCTGVDRCGGAEVIGRVGRAVEIRAHPGQL